MYLKRTQATVTKRTGKNFIYTTPALGTPSAGVMTNMTGAVEASLADNAITLAKMASGTDGNIISFDASGNPVAIATGSDGQVLSSTGAGNPPAMEGAGAPALVGIRVHVGTTSSVSDNGVVPCDTVDTDNQGFDTNSGLASSKWEVPSAGYYLIMATFRSGGGGSRFICTVKSDDDGQLTSVRDEALSTNEDQTTQSMVYLDAGDKVFMSNGSGGSRTYTGVTHFVAVKLA